MLPVAATTESPITGSRPPNTPFPMWYGSDSAVSGFIPMGRAGRASDIVGTIVYMASQAGAYTTGALLKVDGGSALA